MTHTTPQLADLHPWLRARVLDTATAHAQAFPERTLCLIWGHRTRAEQLAAYRAGRSGIDGERLVGLHNYLPALAADLWVYTDPDVEPPNGLLWEGRPPRQAGAQLQLLQRGSFRRFYLPLGELAEQQGLQWGGRWRKLRDGPHLQPPMRQRLLLLQEQLLAAGYNPGPLDGVWGKRTRAALQAVHLELRRPFPSWRQRRTFPCDPRVWERIAIHPRNSPAVASADEMARGGRG